MDPTIPYKNNNYIDGVGAECIKSILENLKIKKQKFFFLKNMLIAIFENKKNLIRLL